MLLSAIGFGADTLRPRCECRNEKLFSAVTQGFAGSKFRMSSNRDLDQVLARLARSSFRARFQLRGRELEYLRSHGMERVLDHAAGFVDQRLAPAMPFNDGRQTPYRNHPVFVAQHATATCCRACLEKWHGIGKGLELTAEQRRYVLAVLGAWIRRQDSAQGGP
jgi:hypothetical protein